MTNSLDQDQVDWAYEEIEAGSRSGESVEAVVSRMLRNPWGAPPDNVLDAAVEKFHHNAKLIVLSLIHI